MFNIRLMELCSICNIVTGAKLFSFNRECGRTCAAVALSQHTITAGQASLSVLRVLSVLLCLLMLYCLLVYIGIIMVIYAGILYA